MAGDTTKPDVASDCVTGWQWLTAFIIGTGLSIGLWHGLLTDQGLVGGDTWSYFLPQKLVLADALQHGRIPLWHDLSGLGYPLLAESQAAVFYPTNQILYRILDPAKAYYSSIVLHYALAFVFAWRFARCQSLSMWSAVLAAMIFVYGWFPARVSLEWSIVGGVWLPLTLWQTHELLNRPSRWRFALLATCLAVHLLAGHFTLAFVNQQVLIGYTLLYSFLRPSDERPSWLYMAAVPAAIMVSLLLASIQLVPTMELKLTSQREGVSRTFDPGYGHMPPLYLSQLVASWTWWHTPEIRQSARMQRLPGSIASDTNAVEAHFYLGLIPFFLAVICLVPGVLRRVPAVPKRSWTLLILVSLIYATGWLVPITRHLPGYSFFMGPGRYTIVATLGGAILAGLAIDALFRSRLSRTIAVIVIAGLTWPDLHWSSQPIADAVQVPAIWPLRENSWVRQYFEQQARRSSRLLMDGQNVGNLFGVSCIPQYLGLGPAVYFGKDFALSAQAAGSASDEERDRMRAVGITHVLTTEPIREAEQHYELIDARPDGFLNAVWGRGNQSCYLYALTSPGERMTSDPPNALQSWTCLTGIPEICTFELDLRESALVRLSELDYPGWSATIDGEPVESVSGDKLHRTVNVPQGQHRLTWRYNPMGYRIGLIVTLVSLTVLWSFPFMTRRNSKQETHS